MNNYQISQSEFNHCPSQILNSNSIISGIIPYGFEIKRNRSESGLEDKSFLEQVSKEINIVKMIHSLSHSALRCKSYNCQSITDELNVFGIQRRGTNWTVKLVEMVLTNHIYLDSNIFILRRKNKQDEIFIVENLPIIPSHVFEDNQSQFNSKPKHTCHSTPLSSHYEVVQSPKLKRLKNTQKLTSSKTSNKEADINIDKALLSEIAKCGTCKSKLTLIKNESGFKYVCSKNNIKEHDFCSFTPIGKTYLETKVVTFLRRTAFKRGFLNVTNQQVIDKTGQFSKNNICDIVIKSKKDSTVRIKLLPTTK